MTYLRRRAGSKVGASAFPDEHPRRRMIIAIVGGLIGLVIVGACSNRLGGGSGGGSGNGAVHIAALWESGIRAVERPRAADDSVVFHALTESGTFQMVSLDPRSGRTRWTAPASPSTVPPGVGLSAKLLRRGKVVVWMEPGEPISADDVSTGGVSVVAAEAKSGNRLWTYGEGRLRLPSAPVICGESDICVPASNGSGPVVLNGRSGAPRSPSARAAHDPGSDSEIRRLLYRAVTAAVPTPGPDHVSGHEAEATPSPRYFRSIGSNLYDNGRELTAYTDDGVERWTKPYSALFEGLDVSPGFGWKVDLRNDLYVLSLAYVPSREQQAVYEAGAPLSRDASRIWATAAFSAQAGDTRWVHPTATTHCGSLVVDLDHPVQCIYTGTVRYDSREPSAADVHVTLEGFDPEDGRTTWQWRAGVVPGLVVGDKNGDTADVLRIDDTRYVIRTPERTVLLDLDAGPLDKPPPASGWCSSTSPVEASFRVVGKKDKGAYRDRLWYPCVEGRAVDVPSTTPRFAGALIDNVYIWRDGDGRVRGGRVG